MVLGCAVDPALCSARLGWHSQRSPPPSSQRRARPPKVSSLTRFCQSVVKKRCQYTVQCRVSALIRLTGARLSLEPIIADEDLGGLIPLLAVDDEARLGRATGGLVAVASSSAVIAFDARAVVETKARMSAMLV